MALTKKNKVLQTALKMVASGGFNGSPMSELARKSGVAVGTIYHYYASKDDIIKDLYMLCEARMTQAIETSLQKEGKIRERFENLWRALYTHYINYPQEFSFLRQYQNTPVLRNSTHADSENVYPVLSDFFKAGIKKGSVRKSETGILTEILFAILHSAVALHLSKNKKNLSRKDIDDFVEMTWAAIKS